MSDLEDEILTENWRERPVTCYWCGATEWTEATGYVRYECSECPGDWVMYIPKNPKKDPRVKREYQA